MYYNRSYYSIPESNYRVKRVESLPFKRYNVAESDYIILRERERVYNLLSRVLRGGSDPNPHRG